jgi:hypothetical protein
LPNTQPILPILFRRDDFRCGAMMTRLLGWPEEGFPHLDAESDLEWI